MEHYLDTYRHHRHPSNASETSSSSPFPDHIPIPNAAQLPPSSSPAPSFVDEPLPMEGEFATMDIHSPPNSLGSSFLHQPSSQAFRYDTLTWAKDHPYPDPQDTLLAPKSSVSNLAALFDPQPPPPDPAEPPFQHTHHSSPSSYHQQIGPPSDRLDRPAPLDRSHRPESSSLSHASSGPQIPTITSCSLSSNPASPLLRLNMNHPAMPNGPSISLTSATPLTAKPGEPLDKFFESVGPLHSRSTNGHTNSHSLGISQAADLLQPLVAEGSMQASHQMCPTQQNSYFNNTRPVRARQRSKSESMGKQMSTLNGADAMAKFFFASPPAGAPPSTEFASATNPWEPSSSTASSSYLNHSSPPQPSHYWAPFQTTPQAAPTAQSPLPQPSPNDGRSLLMQQFIDSSYLLGGLFDQLDHKKELENYDSSFLKPTTTHVNHRRSHSVSHIHRRGRSEGGILPGKIENEPVFDSFLSMTSSTATSPCLVSSPGQMNSMPSMGQNLVPTESNWSNSFPGDVVLDNYTMQHFTSPQVHSPVPSDTCLSSQYSSRARSFSHGSSFGSEETGGSGGPPSTSLVPLELRSRTTAATKAAAVKRRKAGVAARYVCDMCGETFTRRYNLRGHQRAHKGEKPFACGYPGCTSRFARAHDQKRHYKLHLGVKDYSCPACKKTFIRLDALQRHHKSDAGQACYQQLEQTRIKSTASVQEDLPPFDSHEDSNLSFSTTSGTSHGFDNEDEPKPFLGDHSSIPDLIVRPGNSSNSHPHVSLPNLLKLGLWEGNLISWLSFFYSFIICRIHVDLYLKIEVLISMVF